MLWLRIMRCVVVQGLGRALLWIILLGAAGYAAFNVTTCEKGTTCVIPYSKR